MNRLRQALIILFYCNRLGSEQTLKEHDRAVLANAVNHWRGMREGCLHTNAPHQHSRPCMPHQRPHWTAETGPRLNILAMDDSSMDTPSTDGSSSVCIPADRVVRRSEAGRGSERTESLGTSEELSLRDLPLPDSAQCVLDGLWCLCNLSPDS